MRNYVSRLHLVGISTLAVLTVGLALLGWSLRPASGGYPVVTSPMAIFAPALGPGAVSEDFTEALTSQGNGAVMTLTYSTPFVNLERKGGWSLYAFDPTPGWRVCTPSHVSFREATVLVEALLPRQRVIPEPGITGTEGPGSTEFEIASSGPLFVKLCWSNDGPVESNGSYLSAYFVPVSNARMRVNLTRQLNLGMGSTAGYSIQSAVQPSSETSKGWQWSSGTPSNVGIAVSTVNTSETQHDTYLAFLSGIVFGIAGGALVALIQELVAPFRTRRELRPPEPGG
jgi:hypothetical protein